MELSDTDKKIILTYIRELLKARLTRGPEPALDLSGDFLAQRRGIFVTLKKKGRLRGCIGQILGHEPLGKSVRRMTLAAAFEDPRFPSLALNELEGLEVHVSLLTEPKPVGSWKDIRTGTDGIIVSHGLRKGVYLPEVATETGWDARTFFVSCVLEKAGIAEADLDRVTIEVFQTEGISDKS